MSDLQPETQETNMAPGPDAVTEEGHPVFGAEQGEPEWYCPECGARYFAPGVCQNGHAPAELQKIADAETETADEPSPPSSLGAGGDEASGAEEAAAPAADASASEAIPEPPVTAPSGEVTMVSTSDPGGGAGGGGAIVTSPVDQAKSLIQKALDILHAL